MTKRNEEESNSEIYIMVIYCIFLYAVGVALLYFKALFGLGFILVSTLFFVPTLIEARKKIRGYLKKRRIEKLRKNRETVVVGGTPQEHHHKKKRQPDVFDYPGINGATSKGKMMEELGLWYDKPAKRFSFEEKETIEPTKSSTPGRTYRQLNELFDALNYRKRIRIAHDANIGSGHHGNSIRKMVETEAKRRGVYITVIEKGKDIIIEMKRSKKRVV